MGLEEYLSNIIEEITDGYLDPSIIKPDTGLTDEEDALLIEIVKKIIRDQLLQLKSRYLDPIFQHIYLCLDNNAELLDDLIDIVTYSYPESIPKEKIQASRKIDTSMEIFTYEPHSNSIQEDLHDDLLENQLKELGGEEFFQTCYTPSYYLRHRFFLNKPFSNNELDIPASISKRLLTVSHDLRSIYLNGETRVLSPNEKELLARIYPKDNFTPLEAKQDNESIELSDKEIAGAVRAYFDWIKEEGADVFLDTPDETLHSKSDPLFGNITNEIRDDRGKIIARRQKEQQLIKLAKDGDKEEVLTFLSEEDIEPDKILLNGMTVLMIAADHGKTVLVETLIKDLKVNINITQDITAGERLAALDLALSHHHLKVVKILLENGANVSVEKGIKLLSTAAERKDAKLVSLMLNKDHIRIVYKKKLEDLLIMACRRNDLSTIKQLISAGVNHNPHVDDSRSLIHYAAEFSTPGIFQLLTQYTNAKDFFGGTAYPSKFAEFNKHEDGKNIMTQALCKEAEYEHSKGNDYTARKILEQAKSLQEQYPPSGENEEASNQELASLQSSKYLSQLPIAIVRKALGKEVLVSTIKDNIKKSWTDYAKLALFLCWLCFLSTMLLGFAALPSQFFLALAIFLVFPFTALADDYLQTCVDIYIEIFHPNSNLSNKWARPIAHAIIFCIAAYVCLNVNPIMMATIDPLSGSFAFGTVLSFITVLLSYIIGIGIVTIPALLLLIPVAVNGLSNRLGKPIGNFIYTKTYGRDATLQDEIKDLQTQFVTTHLHSTGSMLTAMPPDEAEFTEESIESLLGNHDYRHFLAQHPTRTPTLVTLNRVLDYVRLVRGEAAIPNDLTERQLAAVTRVVAGWTHGR